MSLYVHEFGPADGIPVLALHGVSGHGARFADLSARLPGFHVIAPDLRGHGRSPDLPPWDLRQHLDDVIEILTRRSIGRIITIGHSSGGVLAVRLAHLGRVDRLVLLDPGTLSSKEPELALANAERMRVDVTYATRDEARADRIANGWSGVAPELLDAEIGAHLVGTEDGRWTWRYRRSALIALLGELTRPVPPPPADVPTLLIAGRRSPAVTPEYRAACIGVRIVDVDCGHLVYYERPAVVAEHIAAFLV
ncbi:MAG TPA: alpha/beta hydrolase [Micromonosporaceae bacterium]|jgi:lipase